MEKLYKANNTPLEEQAENLVAGELYFNEKGTGIVYLGDGEFVEVRQSPLNSEFLLNGLTDSALDLFWTLSRKNATDKN